MRTLALTALILALATSPASAITGGHGGNNLATTKLNVINDSENAVVVSANGGTPTTLEPNGSQELTFTTSKSISTIQVNLTATIEGTTIGDAESAFIRVGNKATATITSPTSSSLSIAFSGGGLAKVVLSRDSSVALASSGGLLPLLWIGFVLGRTPRRRDRIAGPSWDGGQKRYGAE